jgi:hypothetical protein
MGLSLRVDVDNPFGYATLVRKILNRISLDYNLIPRWKRLGYLDHALNLNSYLADLQIPATWFFRNETAPSLKYLSNFKTGLSSVALHAERTDTFENFYREIAEWNRRFSELPRGFSKHGSGDIKLSRKHVMEYDSEKLLHLAASTKMEFFIGNGADFHEPIRVLEQLVYIPSVVWLDRLELYGEDFSIKQLAEYVKTHSVVALIHPYWWGTRADVKEVLQEVTESVNIIPLMQLVQGLAGREGGR